MKTVNLKKAAEAVKVYADRGLHVPDSPLDLAAEIGVMIIAPAAMRVMQDAAISMLKAKLN